MTTFAPPAQSGDGVHAADLNGHLLICYPLSVETGIGTVHGVKDAVRLNVADLDTGELHGDALWFGGYLIGALKGSMGIPVLARMSQGIAKPGQSPPWILEDATRDPAAVAAATAWINAHPGALSGTPPIAAPAAAPVAAAAAVQAAPVAAPIQATTVATVPASSIV